MDYGKRACTVRLSLRQIDDVFTLLPPEPTWLSTLEMQRLQKLQTASRRSQFLAGHWLARHTAAHWLGGRCSEYQLSAPEDGSPALLAGPTGVDWQSLCVSLSHSGNWVACALAFQPIGVDVECTRRPRDLAALARWIFQDAELSAFLQLAPDLQQRRFYAQWTLKEAWIKQNGPASLKRLMQEIQFVFGAGASQALVAQNSAFTLAVYPARRADTHVAEPPLPPMQWSEWAYMPPH